MVVTSRATWVGFAVLFLVIVLMAAAIVFWQHMTGSGITHLLLSAATMAQVGFGC